MYDLNKFKDNYFLFNTFFMSGLAGLFGQYGEVEDQSPLPSSLLPSISNVQEELTESKEIDQRHENVTSIQQDNQNKTDNQINEENMETDQNLSEESVRLIALANSYMEPPSEEPADEELTKKLLYFHNLRKQNKTFNGKLFNSKSFA